MAAQRLAGPNGVTSKETLEVERGRDDRVRRREHDGRSKLRLGLFDGGRSALSSCFRSRNVMEDGVRASTDSTPTTSTDAFSTSTTRSVTFVMPGRSWP